MPQSTDTLQAVAPKTFAIYFDMEIVANGHDTNPSETAQAVVATTKSTTLADLRSHLEELYHDDFAYYQQLTASLRSEGIAL